LEGALKMLTLAGPIALTLLSLLLTAAWVLLLEVGRRFWSRADSKPPALEARQRTATVDGEELFVRRGRHEWSS
jgi:hypothetical protein